MLMVVIYLIKKHQQVAIIHQKLQEHFLASVPYGLEAQHIRYPFLVIIREQIVKFTAKINLSQRAYSKQVVCSIFMRNYKI